VANDDNRKGQEVAISRKAFLKMQKDKHDITIGIPKLPEASIIPHICQFLHGQNFQRMRFTPKNT
jgi:hypothetical protein